LIDLESCQTALDEPGHNLSRGLAGTTVRISEGAERLRTRSEQTHCEGVASAVVVVAARSESASHLLDPTLARQRENIAKERTFVGSHVQL